ncbi:MULTISPECIES: hypothetical protein [Aphanothece]|uniref:hypothetical protein n=1 Tax=Aphanothece TaxID=1121 RepID=UPI0039852DBB
MDSLLEARHQLAGMRRELQRGNPELYRHLALYLQVLRQSLLQVIQQACFHLATQVHPDRYCRMTASSRTELHERMEDLVRRASALLTVEQVAAMAAQMARQERRPPQHLASSEAQEPQAFSPAGRPPGRPAGRNDPVGSIQLGMEPPIDPRLLQGRDADASGPAGLEAAWPEVGATAPDLAALLDAMVEALEPSGTQAADTPQAAGTPEPLASPWEGAVLPTDPPTLLHWLDGYERALARRLRNLSHALNVQFLRLGLTRGLLPVGLLDAALSGQVEPLQAPPNLLRLSVPVAVEPGPESGPESMDLVAVLLRLPDLELEQPQLRTCRSRLLQHRQEVRRMAQQYRRVQRRVRTLEAERLWLEDNRRPTTTGEQKQPPPDTSPSPPHPRAG